MCHIHMKFVRKFIISNRYLFFVVFTSLLYVSIVSMRTMPFAEGWYTYYAKLINEGEIVYKDFDYLFSPLYIYFIAIITRFLGYSILTMRFLGVIFYCIIAIILFLIFKELFKKNIACIASICAAFYLQSESVQIFYDYIRMMDIFSLLTILFLIRWLKCYTINSKSKKNSHYLIFAGISNAIFLLIKQNMGIIFFVYSIILICFVYIYYKDDLKIFFLNLSLFCIAFFIPVFFTGFIMYINGYLSNFLAATGSNAIAAKGGIVEILFGWIFNNVNSYTQQIPFVLSLIVILLFFNLLGKKYPKSDNHLINLLLPIFFTLFICFGILIFSNIKGIAQKFHTERPLSPYAIFLFTTLLFIYTVSMLLLNYFGIIAQGKTLERYILLMAISGSYFAISFGCGTSGGLAEGQAGIGVALLVSIFFNSLNFRGSNVIKIAFTALCCLFVLQCVEKKMTNTYNWWGMDESDFWSCTEETKMIPLLKGIKLSTETKKAYEEIYTCITENVAPDETIYCFPQIPIFYSLCDRSDPGVKAKVQWFDVVSDASLEEDMITLENNPPKAILIYQTSDYAYESHETLFRSGEMSGTRKMKNFLLDFAQKYDYTFYGEISSTENNSFLLYYKKDDLYEEKKLFSGGTGTVDDPYLISTADELITFSQQVNSGRDFSGQYIFQTADIDLASYSWLPIGLFDSGCYFKGVYNGNGYKIKNLYVEGLEHAGLFGNLEGTVCNLQLEGGKIQGDYCGAITSYGSNPSSLIVNCYTNITVSGIRAGGITDDFKGKVLNCYSIGETIGIEYANAIACDSSTVENVFMLDESIDSGISIGSNTNLSINIANKDYLKSALFLANLNSTSESLQPDFRIKLLHWHQAEDGYPRLVKSGRE